MRVEEVMTSDVETLPMGVSVAEVAEKMKQLDVGFIPVRDALDRKLSGVVTDRDIVTRCVAERLDPNQATVDRVLSDKVLYCFAGDDISDAAQSMAKAQVYRLVVLDNREEKNLAGIITLADILRHDKTGLAADTAQKIAEAA